MAIVMRPGAQPDPADDATFYPSSDGKPVGETDDHVDLTLFCKGMLVDFFADRPDIYVSGNNFIYYEQGNRRARVSPDGYVMFDVPMRQRDSYFVWREGGKLPNVVFEYTSRSTRREDTGRKFTLYEQTLHVPEYFLFDPKGDYLKPRLQGYRLEAGVYRPLELEAGRLRSEQLGLEMEPDGAMLRFLDPRTGKRLPLSIELTREVEAQRKRVSEQEQRAEAAELEVARLRAELAALRN